MNAQFLAQINTLHFPADLPPTLLEVEQHFAAPRVDDVPAAVRAALTGSAPLQRIRPGMRVAIGAGSRGVANLPAIVRTVVEMVRAAGGSPFVFPAMGSHGGATAEGQVEMLASLGVTPASVGAEILATMAVKEIGQLPDGPSLYQDANAAAADATLLVNRIKPHTDFHGELESGLAKMAVIGMGKDTGAQLIHVYGARGFMRFLAPAARIYAANTNLVGGLALLENAYGETAAAHALDVTEIGAAAETALLEQARALMPRLPFPAIDILVIKEIGKNFSGTGMDTNVVGRIMIPRMPETHQPDVAVIAVLDIAAESHGNAAGIGLANVTTRRAVERIDWVATYTNSVTSGIFGMQRVNIPITMADDRRTLEIAVRGCGEPAAQARWVFINNTSKLRQFWASATLRGEIEAQPHLRIVHETPLAFTAAGVMRSPWDLVGVA
jgi:phage anti-repressor protein